jgi:hypothetical protein
VAASGEAATIFNYSAGCTILISKFCAIFQLYFFPIVVYNNNYRGGKMLNPYCRKGVNKMKIQTAIECKKRSASCNSKLKENLDFLLEISTKRAI